MIRRDKLVGDVIGGYRLINLLGEGAYGRVYFARHVILGAGFPAAIKLLLPHQLNDRGKQKFQHEARIIAKLNDPGHSGIVRIKGYDVQNGTPFIVMDYIAGSTLREYLRVNTYLELENVISCVQQIASALQYAHYHNDEGILHRDIKPENILLRKKDGKVFVSDFGIARVLKKITGELGEIPRSTNGTYLYMAPECFDGDAKPASDQYSLAIVTYECLCGELPFQSGIDEVIRQHRNEPPPSLCQKRPDIPPAVEAVVMKALAKTPEERFHSVQEFAEMLEQAAHTSQQEVVTVPRWWEHSSPVKPMTSAPSISRRDALLRATIFATIVAVPGGIGLYELAVKSPPIIHKPSLPLFSAISSPRIGELLVTYRYPDAVEAAAWSPNKIYIAAGERNGMIAVRDLYNNIVSRYDGHKEAIGGLSWTADSQNILSVSQTQARLWNARTGQGLPDFPAYQEQGHRLLAASWSPAPNNEHVAVCVGDEVHVIDNPLRNKGWGNGDAIYKGHKSGVNAIAWSPDGKLIASASSDMTVHVWIAETGQQLFIYQGHMGNQNCGQYAVLAVDWSPHGELIASADHSGQIHVYSAQHTGTVDRPLYGYSHSSIPGESVVVRSLAWSPNSTRIASGGEDNLVQIWRLGGNGMFPYSGHQASINHVMWSPDPKGIYIASCSDDKTVQIWQASENPLSYKSSRIPA